MKVLQVNNVYRKGSTGKIVYDLHSILEEEGIESVVCYGRGQKENQENIYKTSSELLAKYNNLNSRISGLHYNGSWFATNKLLNIIKKEKPDIVHLQCINGYFVNIYRLLNYLKKNNIKTVLTLHAEFMYTGSYDHIFHDEKQHRYNNYREFRTLTKSYFFDRYKKAWFKMNKSLSNFESLRIVAVSDFLRERAQNSQIMSSYSVKVIENGIETENTFKPSLSSQITLKNKLGLKDEKIIIHVTAKFTLNENDNKGGHYVVQLAKMLLEENIKIIVIGATNLTLDLPKNIINIGKTNNQEELAEYYSLGDLTLITSKRETFSMVCAESLSCGTPVVGFKAGGPETISLPEFSKFIDYGNLQILKQTVINWINLKSNLQPDEISKIARENYSRQKMGQKYIELYNELNQMK